MSPECPTDLAASIPGPGPAHADQHIAVHGGLRVPVEYLLGVDGRGAAEGDVGVGGGGCGFGAEVTARHLIIYWSVNRLEII